VPTYEYQCESDHQFEVVQAFSDKALESCPQCGKKVRKIYSNVGVVFKGSGFYKTDSQTKPSTTIKTESKTEVKTETKTESKPAKTTD
jgi:putative FmdB family regulatory protein